MLKFLRKYQLFILVIGGALLMVVFLLEPVITRLAPSPAKRKVGVLETTGQVVRQSDIATASLDLEMLERIAPWVIIPQYPTVMITLAPDEDRTTHWMLLVKEAEANGLIGEAGDGYAWLPELARQGALVNSAIVWAQSIGLDPRDQRVILLGMRQQQVQQDAMAATPEVENELRSRVAQFARSLSYLDEEDIARSLARARGVSRLLRLYTGGPRLSVPGAVAEARAAGDAVMAEASIVPASALAPTLPASTPEQIQAHFERFRDVQPSENEFGIGYVRGPRLKISYLTIDPSKIRDQLTVDRIALRKRYEQHRDRYPGEFEDERYKVEAEMKTERMRDLITVADEAVRAEVFRATDALGVDGPFRELPEDWDATRPRWEAVAAAVAERLSSETGSEIAAPEVTTIEDRWLTQSELRALPGLGSAAFQGTGTVLVRPENLIEFVREIGDRRELIAQVGLPMVENPAIDASDTRYYVTVLDARAQSAPDDPSEIGTDVLARDERELRAYEQLVGMLPNLVDLARARGVEQVARQFDNQLTGQSRGAEYAGSVAVRRDGASGARLPAMNAELVREALLDAGSELPDIVEVGTLGDDAPIVPVAVPAQRAVVVAEVTGKTPYTVEQFRGRGAGGNVADQLRQSTASRVLLDNRAEDSTGEFGLESMIARWGYVPSRTNPAE